MWASLYNFLYNKLFHKPEVKSPSSNSSAIDPAYGKRLRLNHTDYDTNDVFIKNQPSQSFSVQSKSNFASNDDDCCVIGEVYRRKFPAPSSTTVGRYDSAFTERSSTRGDVFPPPQPVYRSTVIKKKEDGKIVDAVKYPTTSERDLYTKTPNPRPKFFNHQRLCPAEDQSEESKLVYKINVKNKINYLQQSYRLKEKFQYLRLLQKHTSRNVVPAASTKIHYHRKKTVPKEIQLIDLTKEKTNEGNIRSPRKSSTVRRRKSSDQDVQFIREVPVARSFDDIIKTNPVETEDDIQEVLIIDADDTPEALNLSELDRDSVTIIDDEDEAMSYAVGLEEKMRKFVKITSSPSKRKMVNYAEVVYLPKLTPDQEEKVEEILEFGSWNLEEPLVKDFGITIKRRDIRTLAGSSWLNDEIMNFYMNLIMERSLTTSNLPKVYAFNTFFYPKLLNSGYKSLKRWTNKVDIFSFDIVLVPLHLSMHWSLAVIDFRYKSIKYYDSMGASISTCLKTLLYYLKDETLDKKGKDFCMKEWETGHVREVPHQMNGADCGVFACVFAEYLARDSGFWFNQDHMSYFRKKMVLEILEKKLIT